MQPSRRIADLKPYFFATLNSRLADLRARGVDVIRLDMGSPDLPPAEFIRKILAEEALKPVGHGYTPYGGTREYRLAISAYYRRRFAVELDPQHQVLGLIGSKEGIFHLSQVMLDPGDLVLIPDPGYPTYAEGARVAGAEIFWIPLREENGYLPDLEAIPGAVARQARLLWLNYPNNPTGATASLEFFESAVEFARQHDLVLLHDAPYVEVCFEGYRAPSVMQVSGAAEVAVELNSLSKSYNMAGWRLGMAVGNAQVLSYLHAMKVKVDSSHFGPIQTAGAAALAGDQNWLQERNAIYQERRDIMLAHLEQAGLRAREPNASLYVWFALPEGMDEVNFCRHLVEETGVSMTPGTVFGPAGKGYVRSCICTPTPRVREAMDRFHEWIRVRI